MNPGKTIKSFRENVPHGRTMTEESYAVRYRLDVPDIFLSAASIELAFAFSHNTSFIKGEKYVGHKTVLINVSPVR